MFDAVSNSSRVRRLLGAAMPFTPSAPPPPEFPPPKGRRGPA